MSKTILEIIYELTGRGRCLECGTFFEPRQRSNVYCSRSCAAKVMLRERERSIGEDGHTELPPGGSA